MWTLPCLLLDLLFTRVSVTASNVDVADGVVQASLCMFVAGIAVMLSSVDVTGDMLFMLPCLFVSGVTGWLSALLGEPGIVCFGV